MSVTDGGAGVERARSAPEGPAYPLFWFFAAIAATAALSVFLGLTGRLPLWAAGALNVIALYLAAHINHEAVHSNLNGSDAKLKWLNEAIGHFGSFWLFLPLPAFRAVHLAHHRLTNHKELDGDMWMAGKHPVDVFLRCSTLLWGYEIRLHRLARKKLIEPRVVRAVIVQRLLAIALIVVAFLAGYGLEIMALWVIPALVTMPILAYMFAYVVHHPHDSEERYRSARVIRARGRLGETLGAVFVGQNYHLIHHLHPRVPFYRYAKLYRSMEGELRARGATILELN